MNSETKVKEKTVNKKLLYNNIFKAERLLEKAKLRQHINLNAKPKQKIKSSFEASTQAEPILIERIQKATSTQSLDKIPDRIDASAGDSIHNIKTPPQVPISIEESGAVPVMLKPRKRFNPFESFDYDKYVTKELEVSANTQENLDNSDLTKRLLFLRKEVSQLKQKYFLEYEKEKGNYFELEEHLKNSASVVEFNSKPVLDQILHEFHEFNQYGLEDLIRDCFNEKKILKKSIETKKITSEEQQHSTGKSLDVVRRTKTREPIAEAVSFKLKRNTSTKQRSQSNTIPPFYNVKVTDRPVFLRRTGVRPPSLEYSIPTKAIPKVVSEAQPSSLVDQNIQVKPFPTTTFTSNTFTQTLSTDDKGTSVTPKPEVKDVQLNTEYEYSSWLQTELVKKLNDRKVSMPEKSPPIMKKEIITLLFENILNSVMEKLIYILCVDELFNYRKQLFYFRNKIIQGTYEEILDETTATLVKQIVQQIVQFSISTRSIAIEILETMIDGFILELVSSVDIPKNDIPKNVPIAEEPEFILNIPKTLPTISEDHLESAVEYNEIAIQTSVVAESVQSTKPPSSTAVTTESTTVVSEGEIITDLHSDGQVVERIDYRIIKDFVDNKLTIKDIPEEAKQDDDGSEKGLVGNLEGYDKASVDCSAVEVGQNILSPGEINSVVVTSPESGTGKPSFFIKSESDSARGILRQLVEARNISSDRSDNASNIIAADQQTFMDALEPEEQPLDDNNPTVIEEQPLDDNNPSVIEGQPLDNNNSTVIEEQPLDNNNPSVIEEPKTRKDAELFEDFDSTSIPDFEDSTSIRDSELNEIDFSFYLLFVFILVMLQNQYITNFRYYLQSFLQIFSTVTCAHTKSCP